MARRIALLIIAFMLVSSALIAARPMPTTTMPSTTAATDTQLPSSDEEEAACENLKDDECLIRRTLIAHTDYIYTQNKGHP